MLITLSQACVVLLVHTKVFAVNLVDFVRDIYSAYHIECGRDALKQVLVAVSQIDRQLERPTRVSELSEMLVLSHLNWLRNVRNLSPNTVHRRKVHLMGVWKLAFKKGFVEQNPALAEIPDISRPKKIPVAWSIADLEAMLRQANRVQHPLFGPKHWKSLLLLIYFTGLRIGAVLNLQRSHLKGRFLFVPHTIQKDGEDQQFRLPNDLVSLLVSLPRPVMVKHGRQLNSMLIPWPWSMHRIQKVLTHYILTPAGLPDSRYLKFHAMRRTVATVIAATNGREMAMRTLGHSSMSVTERYLADPASVDPSLTPNFAPMDAMPRLRVS